MVEQTDHTLFQSWKGRIPIRNSGDGRNRRCVAQGQKHPYGQVQICLQINPVSDRNVFTAVLPRQDSLEPNLKLLLMPKDGKSVEKEYDLYEIFRKKGYDWNADDLDDISIGI